MAQGERFPAPPPPSLPREAPWKEIEEIIDGLRAVATRLDSMLSALAGLPPRVPAALVPPAVITPPGVPPPAITLDGRLDALVRFTRMPLHWGKATGGSSDKLVHHGMNWEDDMWAGYEVAIIEGTGAGQVRTIKSNDKDILTPIKDWSLEPDHTSVYVIRPFTPWPIEKANQHNVSVTTDTNILTDDLTPTRPPCVFRIMVGFSSHAPVFKAVITKNSTSTTVKFNENTALTLECIYLFDLLVHDGDSVNFQSSLDATLDILRVQEMPTSGYVSQKSALCFVDTTLVHTPAGMIAIEELRLGDTVYAMNLETGQIKPKKVRRIIRGTSDDLVRVTTKSCFVESTPNHPYRLNGRWVEAEDLMVGDKIVTATGVETIEGVERIKAERAVRDLHIADYSTYFVSTEKLLVHNK